MITAKMKIPKDLSYASLSFVKSEPHYEYNLAADIMDKKLTLSYYNDICDNLYVFDEQTTAKFETRFQSLGNPEKFLWRLKKTYVRNGDTVKETLDRILAYCDRKGMPYKKYTDVSFDERD